MVVGLCLMGGALVVATGASAAPRLTFTWEGAPYSGATVSHLEFGPNGAGVTCSQWYEGQASGLGGTVKDTLAGPAPVESNCFDETSVVRPEYASTLGLTSIAFSWNGQARSRGTTNLTTPGPCIYSFNKLAGMVQAPFPTQVDATGSATGFLRRNESLLSCAPLETVPWFVHVGNATPVDGSYVFLGAELFG